jgi:hypothetical protein
MNVSLFDLTGFIDITVPCHVIIPMILVYYTVLRVHGLFLIQIGPNQFLNIREEVVFFQEKYWSITSGWWWGDDSGTSQLNDTSLIDTSIVQSGYCPLW